MGTVKKKVGLPEGKSEMEASLQPSICCVWSQALSEPLGSPDLGNQAERLSVA